VFSDLPLKWSKKDGFCMRYLHCSNISQGIYIIENRFNNNSKILKTKMIIFKIFHNFPDNFRLIQLRAIAEIQKNTLRNVVSYLPCKKSGK
jgi:hypothetical protein